MVSRRVSRRKGQPSNDPAVGIGAASIRWEATFRSLEAFDCEIADDGGRSRIVAGVDEAGRGALAGPVVSAAVILPRACALLGVDDSKKVPEHLREELFARIVSTAVSVRIAFAPPSLIDRINILQATLVTMRRAVVRLRPRPDIVLVDGRDAFEWDGPVVTVCKGDGRSLSIAAASIVAKVARDRLMRRLHVRFPQYNFASNKGYGSQEHVEAILAHGIAGVHRRSFHLKAVENEPEMF